jgi:hypothetical protein
MLVAKRISFWRARYRVLADDRPVTTWDTALWRSGGDFVLDGRRYEVRGNFWGGRFTMLDDAGAPVAAASRVGRKRWTVDAAGQTFQFQRASIWSGRQELYNMAGPIGVVRRTSLWRGDVAGDLPGMTLPVQIFVLGVIITLWDAQSSSAAG